MSLQYIHSHTTTSNTNLWNTRDQFIIPQGVYRGGELSIVNPQERRIRILPFRLKNYEGATVISESTEDRVVQINSDNVYVLAVLSYYVPGTSSFASIVYVPKADYTNNTAPRPKTDYTVLGEFTVVAGVITNLLQAPDLPESPDASIIKIVENMTVLNGLTPQCDKIRRESVRFVESEQRFYICLDIGPPSIWVSPSPFFTGVAAFTPYTLGGKTTVALPRDLGHTNYSVSYTVRENLQEVDDEGIVRVKKYSDKFEITTSGECDNLFDWTVSLK